jgi:hypothetical protein
MRSLIEELEAREAALDGAEAVLKLRAVKANQDLDAYFAYHLAREHQRLYLTPDQHDYDLMA